MELSERRKDILSGIVEEYIKSAEPVSSGLLEKRYKFRVCPATIRNEMQRLAEDGFIFQPHTSAGRVPTDKGYRFFVDNLLEKEFVGEGFDFRIEEWLEADEIKMLQSITKDLASISSNLALGYLPGSKILWKDGWEEIIKEPEFEERDIVGDFIGMLEGFEKEIDGLEVGSEIKVYIGRENPLPKSKEFSTIITKCHFPEEGESVLAIMGPKRMDYGKSIGSLHYLIKSLEKI
jgi:transcriptional regulator of heat shock response